MYERSCPVQAARTATAKLAAMTSSWFGLSIICTSTMLTAALISGCGSTVRTSTTAPSSTLNSPQFNATSGTYTNSLAITISDPYSTNATIYYTTDGSTPTTSSTLYSASVLISMGTTTLEAVAYLNGSYSKITSATYVIVPSPPQFSAASGAYDNSLAITINDPSSSAAIYYTTNGSTPTTASTLYSSPVSIPTGTTTLQAVAYSNGNYSTVTSATYTVTQAIPNAPQFSAASGTYTGSLTVTITDSTSGAAIYYTTNGSTPTTSSTLYSSPGSIPIGTTTLQAVAYLNGVYSAVTSANYTVAPAAPQFSAPSGTYANSLVVTITDSTNGAAIYYTTNGSVPTTSSTLYSSSVSVSVGTTTLEAVAYSNGVYSAVTSATYTVTQAAPNAPQFSAASGLYANSLTVTITDSTSGAAIYYTTNGSTPTTSSTPYSAPVSIPLGTTTLEAVAYLNGVYSAVTSATYMVSLESLITADATSGTAINPHEFGASNIWYYLPDSSFGSFWNSIDNNVGITYMRYPGGYESESYNWSNNTLDTSYRNYTPIPGVTPTDILLDLGKGNVSFVMRTEDALEANTAAEYQMWATQAANLVTQYGGQVKDWQIGNEWYNDGGAHANYQEFLGRYSTLLTYFVPAMQAAATSAGYSINIWASANWAPVPPDTVANDVSTMKNAVGPTVWAGVYGLDLHIYSGIDPDSTKFFVQLPISQIGPAIASAQAAAGKTPVYVSEWAADLQDDDKLKGLENANAMMQIFGEFAKAGVSIATYWPPVFVNTDAQADTITLVNNTPGTYAVDADGQAMYWLSSNYRGLALNTTVTNTVAQSVAAKNGNQVAVFVMTNTASNQTQLVQVNGFFWSQVVSAQVMYATGSSVSEGPAQITALPYSIVTMNGENAVQFVADPGGTNRGSGWEIIKLVLQ